MPLLCLKCDSRVERSAITKTTYWCPGCEKELKRDATYKVGKRHFASGVGMMLAAAAAMSQTGNLLVAGQTKQTKPEVTSTFRAMARQKRRKLKGLKMKQRRLTRQKGGR